MGEPHLEHKLALLKSNLAILRTSMRLKVSVCCYQPVPTWDEPDVTWHVKKGIVGEFIMEFANPDAIQEEYVMILLDDVELQPNFDGNKLIEYQKRFGFDILSPTLTRKSKYQFEYMRTTPGTEYQLKITPCCECFCMFFPHASYQKYYNLLTPHNPWLWGLDMMLYKVFQFRIGMLNKMTMHHHYKGESYDGLVDPSKGREYEFNTYHQTEKELARQVSEHYWITENPSHT